jgi:hypothetical protein
MIKARIGIGLIVMFAGLVGVPSSAADDGTCTPGISCHRSGKFTIPHHGSGPHCLWTTKINWGKGNTTTVWRNTGVSSFQYNTVGIFTVTLTSSGKSDSPKVRCTPRSTSFKVQVPVDNSFTQNFGCAASRCTRITASRKKEYDLLKSVVKQTGKAAISQVDIGPSSATGALERLGRSDRVFTALWIGGWATAVDQNEKINEILRRSVVVPDGSPDAIGPQGGIIPVQPKAKSQRALTSALTAQASRTPTRKSKALAEKDLKALARNLKLTQTAQRSFTSALVGTTATLPAGNVAGYNVRLIATKRKANQVRKLLVQQITLRKAAARSLSTLHLPHLTLRQARGVVDKAKHGSLPRDLSVELRKSRVPIGVAAAAIAAIPPKELTVPFAKSVASNRGIALLRKEATIIAVVAAG